MFTSTNAILSSCSANCIFKRVSCRQRFETAASGRSSRMRTPLQQPTGLRTAGQVTPAHARARVCCHCTRQHRSLPQTCDGWFGGWKEAVSSSAPAFLKPPATFPVLVAELYANANHRVEAVLGRLQKSFHQPVSLRKAGESSSALWGKNSIQLSQRVVCHVGNKRRELWANR